MTTVKVWIEPRGKRFGAVEESILFPGHRNRVHATWASRDGVRRAIKRWNNRVMQPGDCPLPHTPEAMLVAYRNKAFG